jgi:hypothetical protein
MATGWKAGVRFPTGAMKGLFSIHHRFQTEAGAHLVLCPMGTGEGDISRGVKWSGHEANHSPSSAEWFINVWSYTSTLSYVFMAWCLIQDKENSTYVFPYLNHPGYMTPPPHRSFLNFTTVRKSVNLRQSPSFSLCNNINCSKIMSHAKTY